MPRQKSTHVDDPREVGRRLKEAREAAGVSQRRLAFPGCSPAYISRIEAGERIPSLQILRELGSRLDVDAEYLATGSGDLESAIVDAEIALRLGELDQAQAGFEETLEGVSGTHRVRVLTGLGEVASRRSDMQGAIARFEEALAAGGGDPAQHPSLAESMGRAYAAVGRLPEAIAIFRRCVTVQRSSDDAVQMIRFACLLGYALTDNAELDEAERVVAEALERAQGLTDPYTRARLYWSQARLLGERGRSEESSRSARVALEVLRLTEASYAIAQARQF
ncbi:MAG: helix-turn-helix domain-containing protein, partial [Gaiellaceae bacterium]